MYRTRKYLGFVFISMIFAACGNGESIDDKDKRNENWCWFVDKQGNGSWIPVDVTGNLEDGEYTLFFSNGAIREKGKLEDGENIDTTFYYNPRNELIKYNFKVKDTLKAEFPNNGKFTLQYGNLSVCEIGTVKNHKREGKWKRYEESGMTQLLAFYKNGNLNGMYREWYPNGNLKEDSEWKNGQMEGKVLLYFENGNLKSSVTMKDNQQVDFSREYYENGNLKTVYFNQDGAKKGPFETYYENGQLATRGTHSNDALNGPLAFFDEQGKLFQTDIYENGVLKQSIPVKK